MNKWNAKGKKLEKTLWMKKKPNRSKWIIMGRKVIFWLKRSTEWTHLGCLLRIRLYFFLIYLYLFHVSRICPPQDVCILYFIGSIRNVSFKQERCIDVRDALIWVIYKRNRIVFPVIIEKKREEDENTHGIRCVIWTNELNMDRWMFSMWSSLTHRYEWL